MHNWSLERLQHAVARGEDFQGIEPLDEFNYQILKIYRSVLYPISVEFASDEPLKAA